MILRYKLAFKLKVYSLKNFKFYVFLSELDYNLFNCLFLNYSKLFVQLTDCLIVVKIIKTLSPFNKNKTLRIIAKQQGYYC